MYSCFDLFQSIIAELGDFDGLGRLLSANHCFRIQSFQIAARMQAFQGRERILCICSYVGLTHLGVASNSQINNPRNWGGTRRHWRLVTQFPNVHSRWPDQDITTTGSRRGYR
jgi:hypothetical protein